MAHTFSYSRKSMQKDRRCKFFSGNDFNSNGKKQSRPESSPASTLHVSGSVSFYRCRSHRSFRKNLRRTIRFDIKFRYIVPNIYSKTSSTYVRDLQILYFSQFTKGIYCMKDIL